VSTNTNPDAMKKIFSLLSAIFILPCLYSQQPIRVYEDSISYGKNKYPGVVVTVPEANYEQLQKDWKKELEARTKSKVVIENGEWSIFGANTKNLSPTPVNLYGTLIKMDSLVELRAAVELKKDVFIEKQSSEMLKLETYLRDFAKNQYIGTASSQLKVEEDTLRQLKKKLSDYEKSESNLKDDIKSSEKSIKEEEDNISALNSELETLSAEIDNQNTQFTSMADGPVKDDKAKYIKDLDKKKKKLGNDIESSQKKIKKANKTIEDAQNEIPGKQSQQEEVKKKIAAQELVVQKYEKKLAAIKLY
jgi:predicted  nucleic acid-binding Zn-ribbon protein